MTCFVVLGAHGGGTSLVASMLDALGVQMYYNPKAKVKWYLNYEDSDWIRLNTAILKAAGGEWHMPPKPEKLVKLQDRHVKRVKALVAKKDKGVWGFKDPRTALTIHLLHPYLPEPKYIFVTRKPNHAAKSIHSRGPSEKTLAYWRWLVNRHYNAIIEFLATEETMSNGSVHIFSKSHFMIEYEDLVSDKARVRVNALRRFVGQGSVSKALGRIKHG